MRARPNIRLIEHAAALDLLLTEPADAGATRRCLGARVRVGDGDITPWLASHTVLATGGLGQVYAQTNPDAATGDGVAMAWRAGCQVADMEFVQFHPTALQVDGRAAGLVTEALRGEGAVLRLPGGERFMPAHDPRAELAPRDIVARAIWAEMSRLDLPYVHLDISHRPRAWLDRHFPAVTALCAAHGIDIATQPMPVAPCAHYACGGVRADVDGATGIAGLRRGRSRAHRPAWRQPAGQQFAAGMRGDGTGGGKRHRRIGRCSKRGSLGGVIAGAGATACSPSHAACPGSARRARHDTRCTATPDAAASGHHPQR